MVQEKIRYCKKCDKNEDHNKGVYLNNDGICLRCRNYFICKACGKEKAMADSRSEAICDECNFVNCKSCGKTKRRDNVSKDGICKRCDKKIKNSHKLCPFCGEEIKFLAIKCRFCNEMLDKNKGHLEKKHINTKKDINITDSSSLKEVIHNKTTSKIAVWAFVLAIASIFFFTIGIIPTLALTFSIISLTKYKNLNQRDRAFAVIAMVLSFIYFLVYLNTYNHI